MVGTIYLFTNVLNGKRYVGQTKHLDRRVKLQAKGKGSPLLAKAIQKYGIENFIITILDTNIDTQAQLDELEEVYITAYQSLVPNGYNIRTGRLDGVKDTRLTLQQEQQIIAMYSDNIRIKDISAAIGMSIGGIMKALERNNVIRRKPIKKQRASKIDYDKVVEMISLGLSNAEIAKEFNTSYKYIWKYRKERRI